MNIIKRFVNWITGNKSRRTSSSVTTRRSSGTSSYRSTGSRYRTSGSEGRSYNVQRGRAATIDRARLERERRERERAELRKKAFAVRKGTFTSLTSNKSDNDNDRSEARRKLFSKTTLPTSDTKKSSAKSLVGGTSSEERKKVRRDVVKYNPKAAGAIGGMASGLTWGATDLLASVDARKDRNSGAANYEKYRSKGAETVGEIAGSLVSFGGAGRAAEGIVGRGLATKGGKKAITKLAENKLVRKSAERAVAKGVRKGTLKAGSEAIVKQVAKDKATRLAKNLAENAVVDATAGAIYDVNKASARHKIGSKEWKKEMRDNALINMGAAGVGVGLGNLKRNKTIINEALERVTKNKAAKESVERIARRNAVGVAKDGKRVVPRIGESIEDRIKRIDAEKSSIALRDLDATGEAGLGQYGRITKNGDKYRLDVSGESEDLTREQAKSYIRDAEARIADDEARASKITPPPAKQRRLTNYEIRQSGKTPSLRDRTRLRADEIDAEIRRTATDNNTASRATGVKAPETKEVKSVTDVVGDYQSKGYKRKAAAARKRAKELLANGDEEGARRVIDKAVEDIVSETNTAIELPSDIKDIQYDLRNSGIALRRSGDKTDAGYKYGSYNELRKRLMGKLKIKEGRNDIEEVYDILRERYGGILPEDPDDKLEELIRIANTKETTYKVEGEEADFLRQELKDALWNEARGAKSTPTVEPNAVRNADEIADDLATERTGQIRNDTVRAEARGDVPNAEPYAAVDDVAEGINPDTPIDTARARTNEIAEGVENSRVFRAGETVEESVDDELPWGVRTAREKLEKATGVNVGKGDKAPTTGEIYDAYKSYHVSQGTQGARRKQSRAAASQINAMSTEQEKALREKLVQKGEGDYEVIFTHELFDQITQEFKADGARWVDAIIDGSEDINKIGAGEIPQMQARCQYLMSVLNPTEGDASEQAYSAAFKLAKDLASKSGQTLNMRRNFVRLTKAGKIESTIDDLVSLLDGAQGFNRKYRKDMPTGKYNRINFIKGKLMEDPEIKKAVTRIVEAKDEDAVSEAYTELLYAFNKNNPKSGYDVVQELRYLGMLGNPKTHIRNMLGSGFFAPIRQVSNMIRAGIEDSVTKAANARYGSDLKLDVKHGGISFSAAKEAMSKNPTTEAGKEAAKALDRRAADLLGSAKYGTPQYKGRGKTIVGKGLDVLSDFNSNLLVKEDDMFKRLAFKENYIKSYNRYLRDGKPITEKVKRAIENEAIQEAQIATFNEYNSFANALQKFTKSATDMNATPAKRWLARGVNALMPFEKVPANLGKQSINYSPIGIARGFYNVKMAAMQGDSQLLNRAIDQLASGVTGTGIFALGMLLGKTTEMFTTNTGKEDPSSKFKKDRGMQNYSINFKDPETGQGVSLTLDWLVPTSATFFAGVEMANQMKKGGSGIAALADWATVTSRLAEPVMETSMLSGLHSMLETMRGGYNGDDELGALQIMGRETAQSYLNSLVPTMAGQIARTAYKSDKQITGDGDWEYFRNSLKSKTGLGADNALTRRLGIESLGADTDAYGNIKNEKKSGADYAQSFLKNFLSPANIQKIDFSQVDEEKLRIYREAVQNGADPESMSYLFPKKQYKKSFEVGDKEVKMSNKELSLYNNAKTRGGAEGMRAVLEGIMFNRYEKDENGKKTILVNGYTKEEKAKLIQQFRGKSLREVEEWLYEQPQFQEATEAERKRTINHLWSLTKETKTVGAQRVGEQAVYKAQGKPLSEYNFKNELSEKKQKALLPYVEAGVLTYAEAVDFARNAGKTYYYENDDGGSSQTYFNKKQMIEYLIEKGYSYEKAEALFNSFKAGNAKPYSGNSLYSGRGYRRRGYRRRGYRRRGRGGSGSSGSGIKIKESNFKAKSVKYDSLVPKASSKSKKKSSKIAPPTIKVTPPTPKKYEI